MTKKPRLAAHQGGVARVPEHKLPAKADPITGPVLGEFTPQPRGLAKLAACRKAADDLHALLLQVLEAARIEDSDAIKKLINGDDCLIARQTIALNATFDTAGLGEPFTT